MNNAPLTLILIASLGIVAVISLGVFFAVRPKFADTDEHLAADVSDQKQLYSSVQPQSTGHQPSASGDSRPHPSSRLPVTELTTPAQTATLPSDGQSHGTGLPHNKAEPGEPTFGQSTKHNGDREIVSTVELLDSLRVPPGFVNEQNVRVTARIGPASTPGPHKNESYKFRELGLAKEVDFHRYGKVVGLAYRKGRLYVPSYQNGNISVYKADTLTLLDEYTCSDCHIYDIGVLSNGDMILGQGKYSKLTKLSNKTGEVVKVVNVTYSTKGIAISSYDEIFVLSRDQDTIYVYDSDLKQLGSLPFVNKVKSDCNFLAYGADVVYVSCESSAIVVNVQGKQIQNLKSSQGASYAVGVSVDAETGNVYVGQRGKSLADVYDRNGTYLQTVGENKDSLWSDIVVGGKHLFVIEYITATIKQYRLR